MNCCNDFGNCTQGRDCPVRKLRMKETDDAYMSGGWGKVADDIASTFKVLIVLIAVIAAYRLFAFFIWGK